jgi:Tfp pilus assembly protein PilF
MSSVVEKEATDNTAQANLITAQSQLRLGHEFLTQQKDREAIKAFKDSIKLNPNIAETHYGLGFSNFRG